jgi:hypothetical protein
VHTMLVQSLNVAFRVRFQCHCRRTSQMCWQYRYTTRLACGHRHLYLRLVMWWFAVVPVDVVVGVVPVVVVVVHDGNCGGCVGDQQLELESRRLAPWLV